MSAPEHLKVDLEITVKRALEEDIGSGDITAALIPANQMAKAEVISRDEATICGRDWVNEVFRQVDPTIKLHWHVNDGNRVAPNQPLFSAEGPARSLLTAERCALNFLQTLSGTASRSHDYAESVRTTEVKLLDTRKTLPGLRNAQKYAVSCGGCYNHRIGLYDAFLIKENHIAACGGIANVIAQARRNEPGKQVEIEVENLEEFQQALQAGADIIMLDNFSLAEMRLAVEQAAGKAKLEASGGITSETLLSYAETGVDYISIGTLTKDCDSVDLSMRFID
ncbi:carboxylating nicotinate-nucleotide diphosphorylase [Motiliproteus coralliicola]|uniref:Probable nicotinate-nucleotide pyrophosphorylase [carboxylating] n=1 Tax=Motiliproteus coralliicola TaxID=2283196 RepID=A0A369WP14_9GAMM|nr:carboxylating nicotinate-nucleotide diphosphorylase [Motiliproteus coralliicola]RDE22809.1 carboxylating nicotinate-nucleotide diphosphorylase [Motiliproteus coralliicola]